MLVERSEYRPNDYFKSGPSLVEVRAGTLLVLCRPSPSAETGVLREDARDLEGEMGHERTKMGQMRPEWGRFAQVAGTAARVSELAAGTDGSLVCAQSRGLPGGAHRGMNHRQGRPACFHNPKRNWKKRHLAPQ